MELRLPKRSNDFDFRRIVDVRLVLYYTALFDTGLRSTVLARPPRAGLSALRNFNLRYDAPDAWYGFYRNSAVDFVLDAVRLPANQTSFAIEDVQLQVRARDGVPAEGIELFITPPEAAAVAVTTDATGAAAVSGADPALVGTSPLGTWHIAITGGAPVTEGGVLQPQPHRLHPARARLRVRVPAPRSRDMREPTGLTQVDLPGGGGGITPLGDRFKPDLVRGTGNYAVPLACPKGPNDLQPQPSLTYSTGSGNGPFGLGWQCEPLRIERRSDRGMPRYDGSDQFTLGGAEVLVPVGGGHSTGPARTPASG